MGKSMEPGGGGRFAKFVAELLRRGYSLKRARAIAASRGRKKYGVKKMAQWAAQARKKKG
jgi:hypothetical protein